MPTTAKLQSIKAEKPPHELLQWAKDADKQMAADYERIQARVKDDPGSAGSRGEGHWQKLLEHWLPSKYHVVKGGQILFETGDVSPQIDVLVLHSSYPKGLIGNQLYLAEAVVAAFECKITLRKRDIVKTMKNSISITAFGRPLTGTPRTELVRPIIYGLLAQSHDYADDDDLAEREILDQFLALDKKLVHHPKQSLDLICVADLATFATDKTAWSNTVKPPGCEVSFMSYGSRWEPRPSPIGSLITVLYGKMGGRDHEMQPLYYYMANILAKGCHGQPRHWGAEFYSSSVRNALPAMIIPTPWLDWSNHIR